MRSVIFGCAGPNLGDAERRFFAESDPFGFILFARNCEDPAQIRRLVDDLRASVGRDAPVLIDQEGGRVRRLRPPHWAMLPPAARIGALYERDPEAGIRAAALAGSILAAELGPLGIDIDCVPVLDVRDPGVHDVIGDRAYSTDASAVTVLGRSAAEALLDGGVLPVMKHMPGHGRTRVDSHDELPVIAADRAALDARDFKPFKALSHLPVGMTGHVLLTAIDPGAPATTSALVISQVIRGGIGFDGLLLTDDISMNALGGSVATRSAAALAAGCDVALHCNGRMDEMQAVAAAVGTLAGAARRRADAVMALSADLSDRRKTRDVKMMEAALHALLEPVAG
jgi:beta-N-acetylhexosaminidase